ncbi:22728_t:CDS:1, partial [Rhizophagus irregularis]
TLIKKRAANNNSNLQNFHHSFLKFRKPKLLRVPNTAAQAENLQGAGINNHLPGTFSATIAIKRSKLKETYVAEYEL